MKRLLLVLVFGIPLCFLISLNAGLQTQAQASKVITNSIGMKLVLIPKGTFMMGSPIEEKGRYNYEEQHQVTISQDYYLGMTEVTQRQYEKVMGINPSYFKGAAVRESYTSLHPVVRVTWDDAVEFCKRLSELPGEKKAGRVYRLPTEAEWEYACRAGSKTAFSFGASPKSLGDYAWFGMNSKGQKHPVGQKKPNAWGLYDMHGNVAEWCSDRYGEYPKGAVIDPVGPREGSDRVFRGGSTYTGSVGCRSAARRWNIPVDPDSFVGCRVAMSPSATPN